MLVTQPCLTLFDPIDWSSHHAPLSMRFFRQEYWSGLSFPSPGDLPDPRIKPRSLALLADSLPSEPPGVSLGFESYMISVATKLQLCCCMRAAIGDS